MGVLPQGTFNYFARAHGIPGGMAEAVHALLLAAPLPVQVGLINDRVFLVNASLGLYPELLQDREALRSHFGRSRLVAVGSTLITLLREHRQLQLQIELGGTTRTVTTPTLFVANNRLQFEQAGLQEAEALDEGCIAAVMLRPIGTLAMLWLLARGAIGNLGGSDAVECFRFHRMIVRPRLAFGRRRVKVAYDGEVSHLPVPIEFRVSPKPLFLLKPGVQMSAEPPGRLGR